MGTWCYLLHQFLECADLNDLQHGTRGQIGGGRRSRLLFGLGNVLCVTRLFHKATMRVELSLTVLSFVNNRFSTCVKCVTYPTIRNLPDFTQLMQVIQAELEVFLGIWTAIQIHSGISIHIKV